MTNEQFTDALAAKSAQLHVGLDNSIRVAFEAGAMWAKEVLDAAKLKEPRPFQAGDKVKWVRASGTVCGTIRNVPTGVYPGYEYVIADINGQRETFWADGRKNAYDPAPSLFHID